MASIHINPKNKGKFNATKKRTGKTTEQLTHSKNPVTKKRAVFAQNAKKWKKGQVGITIDPSLIPNPLENVQYPSESLASIEAPTSNRVQLGEQLGVIEPKRQDEYSSMPYDEKFGMGPKQRQQPTYNGQVGKTALAGLLGVAALLPGQKPKKNILYPSLSYNEHPHGTGSHALAEDGITISTEGYKSTSPDKNKKKLRIPSSHITMKDVPHQVLGVDNTGYTQLMKPGQDYSYPGEYVDEIPIAKDGKWIQHAINPSHKGWCTPLSNPHCTGHRRALALRFKHGLEDGGTMYAQDGTTLERLSPEQIQQFNRFNKFVGDKGLTGSKKLNDQQYSKSLYEEFRKSNPDVALTYEEMIPRAQQEQYLLKDFSTDFAKRRNDPNAEKMMNNITPIDSMYGPKTSYYSLPEVKLTEQSNGVVTKDKNLGIISGSGQLTGYTNTGQANIQKADTSLPKGVTLQKLQDGYYYEDPQTGYLTKYATSLEYGGTLASSGLTISKAKEILKDGSIRGKKLTAKQKRYFGYVAGGGRPKAEDGVTLLDDDTVKFNGPSHENGGIPIEYSGQKVEVEGDETGYFSPVDNSLTVMGNMKNPITGRKFKSDSKILAKKESKMSELLEDGLSLINDNNPNYKWQSLKFNSGKVMAMGAHQKQQQLQQSKEHLKAIQEAMLSLSHEHGVSPDKLSDSLNKAENGLKMDGCADCGAKMTAQRGITLPDGKRVTYKKYLELQKQLPIPTEWKFNQTNTKGLDNKIQEFTNLLIKKGLSGYSGPESGISQRNTKSGHPSRHQTGEALDIFLSQPDAYNKVLEDPELSKYLIDNGLTVINEYDPEVAKKTGATAGHLHIGYDKGTPTSDKFRQDAAAKYKSDNTDWGWGTYVNPKGKIIKGAPQGDQQYFPIDVGQVQFTPITTTPQPPTPAQQPNIPDYQFNFTNPQPYDMPSNAQNLEFTQILPELYAAATNKLEPVQAQKYQPELYEPYQVSFQDRLNQNQSTFRALQQSITDNPGALSTLAGQKYSADSGVLADEFRTNQQIASEITDKNIALLNDAQLKNLGIADTQYTRQAQAKSNTKAVNQQVLNSISNKILENEANNRKMQLYENLYRFRFDPNNNYQAYNAGPSGDEYVGWSGASNKSFNPSTSLKQNFNKSGQLTSFSTTTPSPVDQQLKEYNLKKKKYQPIGSMFNKVWPSGSFAEFMATQ